LYKILSAAIAIAGGAPGRLSLPSPGARGRIVSERTNFPSDLYIADTLARTHGLVLDLIDLPDDLGAAVHPDRDLHLGDDAAILLLTHVNYRTGRMHRIHDITRAAHEAGALMVWDLAHSAGAVPVNLHGDGTGDSAADFAVGCGYKYLNGGPGAPAFAWAHPKHTAWMDREGWRQPLSGWLGHASPFEFTTDYRPGAGMSRFVCGTPPILSLAALECGVESVLAAEAYGGMSALRQKSIELTDLFIDEVESRCARYGLRLASPRHADERGSQVSFAHPTDGYAIVQALIARNVIGDFRAPDILRFGFPPLYTRFVDVWDAADRLEQVLAHEEWRDPRFTVRSTVT
jgi:kynureninase